MKFLFSIFFSIFVIFIIISNSDVEKNGEKKVLLSISQVDDKTSLEISHSVSKKILSGAKNLVAEGKNFYRQIDSVFSIKDSSLVEIDTTKVNK